MLKYFRVLALVCLLTLSQSGWGWGSYGHEQINRAAALSIEKHPFGKWLVKNLPTVQRLGVTPDYDWKNIGIAPEDEGLRKNRSSADRYEHPLHYFEVDAFLPNGVISPTTLKLLAFDLYGTVFPTYAKLLAANEGYVVSIDPAKALADSTNPTAQEVTAHGTAPWRIAQLWNLGVMALKKKDFEKGIMYLGAMGHYVGDSAQPFHGTLDYDGKAHETEAGGIHSSYETKVFEHLAKEVGSTWDKDAKVWLNFDATEDTVVNATMRKVALIPDVTPGDVATIVRRIIGLSLAAYPFVGPLEDVFAEAIVEENGDAKTIRSATIKAFMGKKIGNDKLQIPSFTIPEAAQDQLSNAASLLAKLWIAAYEEAAKADGFDIAEAPTVEFTEELVLADGAYPKPLYLPQVHNKGALFSHAVKETGDAHFPPKPHPEEEE